MYRPAIGRMISIVQKRAQGLQPLSVEKTKIPEACHANAYPGGSLDI